MTIEEQVIQKINQRRRIFLPIEDYKKFIKEIEPKYKKDYGALVADGEASRDGYENVLYRGVAVCLEAYTGGDL